MQAAYAEKRPPPGAVIAIQICGDFLGFHPHLHIRVSDGCFYKNGMFSVAPAADTITDPDYPAEAYF
ncbi:MAG: hypothetical protein QF876_00465 [Desulfobacterales bacterium]|nr:hypothetical protein [Desulfobacterales bacterium]MDP6808734.1 hypothetical protein [Desulfobacterales bacterium]